MKSVPKIDSDLSTDWLSLNVFSYSHHVSDLPYSFLFIWTIPSLVKQERIKRFNFLPWHAKFSFMVIRFSLLINLLFLLKNYSSLLILVRFFLLGIAFLPYFLCGKQIIVFFLCLSWYDLPNLWHSLSIIRFHITINICQNFKTASSS